MFCPTTFEKEINPLRVPLALLVMLLATEGEPMVLLVTVMVCPAVVPWTEMGKKAGTVAGVPVTCSAIPPMVFPVITIISGVPVPATMACRRPAEPEIEKTMLLVADWLPMVLLLQLIRPVTSEIKD